MPLPVVHIKEPLRTDSDTERFILRTASRVGGATKKHNSVAEAEKLIKQAVSKPTYIVSEGFSIDNNRRRLLLLGCILWLFSLLFVLLPLY